MNLKQNDIELTLKNGDTLRKKRFLKLLHIDFYEILLKQASKNINGLIIELGSGAGFLKEIEPKVLTSDILDISGVDLAIEKFTKKIFVIEVNKGPGIEPNARTSPELKAFSDYLLSRIT